jgi:hypothetical protein
MALSVGGREVYLEHESSSWVGPVGGGGIDWTSDRPAGWGWPGRFDLAPQERRGRGPGIPRAGLAAPLGTLEIRRRAPMIAGVFLTWFPEALTASRGTGLIYP